MPSSHLLVDTTRVPNGRHLLTVRAWDEAGNVGTAASVEVVVDNPRVDLDIVTALGTDPVRLKYRAGDSGKNLDITLDGRYRGHVRINGELQP